MSVAAQTSLATDVLVVGGGPAGVAAALRARESGTDVMLVDDNVELGGQIWRRSGAGLEGVGSKWVERLERAGVRKITGSQAIGPGQSRRTVLIEDEEKATQIEFGKLILSTGARELFLPFPGWTLPGVMGVGGLQALAKSGLPLSGKRVIVAGSGPLLLAAAVYFRKCGACIKLVAEQAATAKLAGFLGRLCSRPAKIAEAMGLRRALLGIPYRRGCWVEAAEGKSGLERVRLRSGEKRWIEKCDYLAVAFGLVANVELPAALGCRLQGNVVAVDEFQRSSIEDVYCAGECTGIGGVDLALVEGEIAGYAASERTEAARGLLASAARAMRFARLLERTFELREELRDLAEPETIVCRCEDVHLQELRQFSSFRAAKLHTRCGMGPCQGRVCGPAAQFILGWTMERPRLPIFPARVSSLAAGTVEAQE